jgi:hypothetical protein
VTTSDDVNVSNDVNGNIADDKENQIYQYTPQRPTPPSSQQDRDRQRHHQHQRAINLLSNYNYRINNSNKNNISTSRHAKTPTTQPQQQPGDHHEFHRHHSEQYYHCLVSPSDSSTYTNSSSPTTPDDEKAENILTTHRPIEELSSLSDRIQPLEFDSTLIAACTPDVGDSLNDDDDDDAEISTDESFLIGHIQDYPSLDDEIIDDKDNANNNSSLMCPLDEQEEDEKNKQSKNPSEVLTNSTTTKSLSRMEGFLASPSLSSSSRPDNTKNKNNEDAVVAEDPSELNLVTATQYISGCRRCETKSATLVAAADDESSIVDRIQDYPSFDEGSMYEDDDDDDDVSIYFLPEDPPLGNNKSDDSIGIFNGKEKFFNACIPTPSPHKNLDQSMANNSYWETPFGGGDSHSEPQSPITKFSTLGEMAVDTEEEPQTPPSSLKGKQADVDTTSTPRTAGNGVGRPFFQSWIGFPARDTTKEYDDDDEEEAGLSFFTISVIKDGFVACWWPLWPWVPRLLLLAAIAVVLIPVTLVLTDTSLPRNDIQTKPPRDDSLSQPGVLEPTQTFPPVHIIVSDEYDSDSTSQIIGEGQDGTGSAPDYSSASGNPIPTGSEGQGSDNQEGTTVPPADAPSQNGEGGEGQGSDGQSGTGISSGGEGQGGDNQGGTGTSPPGSGNPVSTDNIDDILPPSVDEGEEPMTTVTFILNDLVLTGGGIGTLADDLQWNTDMDAVLGGGNDTGLHLEILSYVDDSTRWKNVLDQVVQNWQGSGAVQFYTTPGVLENQYSVSVCQPVLHKLKVCHGNYGTTDWKGATILFVQGQTIVAGSMLFNDYNANNENNESYDRYNMCQQFGHALGLSDSTFESGSPSCMSSATEDPPPDTYQSPNQVNFDALLDKYGPLRRRLRGRRQS